MWPNEIHNYMQPPVEMLQSFGDMLVDEVGKRTKASQDRLYIFFRVYAMAYLIYIEERKYITEVTLDHCEQ